MPIIIPFSSEWITFACFLGLILGIVGLSEVLRRSSRLTGEQTRRFVHIGVGIFVIFSPLFFKSALQPALLALIFILLNAVALKAGQMKGMHTTERRSYGTVFFPLTFLILIAMYWYSDPVILMLGMMVMTLADPLASIVGMKVKKPRQFTFWKDPKSVQGSLVVFITTFIIITAFLPLFRWLDGTPIPNWQSLIVMALTVGVVATLAEAISSAGSDNLSLPLSAALMIDVMQSLTFQGQIAVMGWVLFSFLLAYTAYRLKALTAGGAAGAMFLGSVVFSIGGINWVIPMATFFVLSSILSKLGKAHKSQLAIMQEKGSNRDLIQVYANGGVALVMAILYFYTEMDLFYLMFLGSLAAATADTWGTEIGTFSKSQPVHILTGKAVPAGTSGGVTVLGTSGVFVGAGILTLSGIFPLEQSLMKIALIIIISGILGALIDSVLGGTIQAQYRCPVCRKTTEKVKHCNNQATTLISGYRWINNDVVNLVCTLSGALLVGVGYWLLM
ncbi:MAG: DUF92 domain-containing protein [Candidatus Neomarinimicrobiota bacterium]